MKNNKKIILYCSLIVLILVTTLSVIWFIQRPETVVRKMLISFDKSAQSGQDTVDGFFTDSYSAKLKQSQRAQKAPSFKLTKPDSQSGFVILTVSQDDSGRLEDMPVLQFDFAQGLLFRRFVISDVVELDPRFSSSFGRILEKKIEKTVEAVKVGSDSLTVVNFSVKSIDEEFARYSFTLKSTQALSGNIFIRAEDAKGNACSAYTKIAAGNNESRVEVDGFSKDCQVGQLRFFIPNTNEDFIYKI